MSFDILVFIICINNFNKKCHKKNSDLSHEHTKKLFPTIFMNLGF